MLTSVVRRYGFEAAHRLDWHPGRCRRLHGHSYVVEVAVSGPLDERGIVMDFSEVDAVVRPVVDGLDHVLLNDVLDNPTAERVAAHLGDALTAAGLSWSTIRLWETADGSVLLES